jgi:3-oxo-4-pregnene-20-carboxyl-CoA dehydrogenase alpha subunit
VDFTPTETQQAVAEAAARVLGHARPGQPGCDQALWKELGQVGLLGLALPGWLGGDGLSVLEVAALLTEVGQRAATVPALATLMLGVLPLVRCGDRDLQQALLPGVAAGDTLLTAALREPSDPLPAVPATTAHLGGGPGTVSGVKIGVPYAAVASHVLVPVSITTGSPAPAHGTSPEATGIVLVDPAADGVALHRTPTSSHSGEYTLRLDRAPISHVLTAGPGSRAVTDLYQLAVAGACSLADGALAAALELTTAHIGSRQQFGRPLAAFQAVAQQIADIYILARTLRLATVSGCWRLHDGRDAGCDLAVAGYWLAEHAPAALRACHHLHGGLGMDVSYPLHRYSALVKDLVWFVGGADSRLDALATQVCG